MWGFLSEHAKPPFSHHGLSSIRQKDTVCTILLPFLKANKMFVSSNDDPLPNQTKMISRSLSNEVGTGLEYGSIPQGSCHSCSSTSLPERLTLPFAMQGGRGGFLEEEAAPCCPPFSQWEVGRGRRLLRLAACYRSSRNSRQRQAMLAAEIPAGNLFHSLKALTKGDNAMATPPPQMFRKANSIACPSTSRPSHF